MKGKRKNYRGKLKGTRVKEEKERLRVERGADSAKGESK